MGDSLKTIRDVAIISLHFHKISCAIKNILLTSYCKVCTKPQHRQWVQQPQSTCPFNVTVSYEHFSLITRKLGWRIKTPRAVVAISYCLPIKFLCRLRHLNSRRSSQKKKGSRQFNMCTRSTQEGKSLLPVSIHILHYVPINTQLSHLGILCEN
jgi:hypothetical protein